MAEDYAVQSSWATQPEFYEAPHPPGKKPHPYQFAGAEYALARDHCIIGDAPGLGKSCEGILISNATKAKHTLVVCPASLRLNWEREVWMWSTVDNVQTYPVLKASDGVSLEADYVITSYDMLRNEGIFDAIMDQHWDHVILDEAHYLKDPKGNRRTQLITAPDGLPNVAGRFTLATGTLMPNQPSECLGPDTLVLTDSGWKRILETSNADRVWDGEEWVKHEGLTFRGVKKTIQSMGVTITPDHLVLARENWYGAARLGEENIQSQALATASENLPWSVSNLEVLVGCWRYMCAAIAGDRSIKQAKGTYAGGCTAAGLAGRAKASRHGIKNTLKRALTLNFGRACALASATFSRAATIKITRATEPTAGAGSVLRQSGSKTELSSWRILRLCLGAKTLRWKLIASTLIKDTRRATFALLHARKASVEKYLSYNSALMTWSNVYDLVNAGPRNRFTILSDRGPLIVHNCYNAIRLVNWDAIDRASYEDFRDFYYAEGEGFVRVKGKVKWSNRIRNQPRNLEDLNYRLRRNAMVRRLKEHVLTQLPPKQWHPFPLTVTSLMKEAMRHPGWAEAQRLYEMDHAAFDRGVPVDGAISTAMRLLGEAKAPSVAEYIEDLFDSGIKKLVVAGLHHTVLHYLRDRLAEYGVVYMDGGTSSNRKQWAVDQFQNNDDIGIILGQMLPLGEGWTLTAAQDVVFAEFFWVPGKNDQMLDRINRMGQMGDYTIGHIPVVPGTLDERVLGTAIEKDGYIYEALDRRAA